MIDFHFHQYSDSISMFYTLLALYEIFFYSNREQNAKRFNSLFAKKINNKSVTCNWIYIWQPKKKRKKKFIEKDK